MDRSRHGLRWTTSHGQQSPKEMNTWCPLESARRRAATTERALVFPGPFLMATSGGAALAAPVVGSDARDPGNCGHGRHVVDRVGHYGRWSTTCSTDASTPPD